MAYTIEPDKLIRPITHVVIDTPVPAYGTHLTLVNGFPAAGGRDVGEMEDAPVLKRPRKINEEKSVTSPSPIDFYITDPSFEMDVSMKRHIADNLKLALQGESIAMPDGSMSIGIGTDTELESHSAVVVWETRGGSGVYGYAMIYDAIIASDVEIGLSPDKSTVVKVTFKARPVSGRPTGFQLGEYNIPQALV